MVGRFLATFGAKIVLFTSSFEFKFIKQNSAGQLIKMSPQVKKNSSVLHRKFSQLQINFVSLGNLPTRGGGLMDS